MKKIFLVILSVCIGIARVDGVVSQSNTSEGIPVPRDLELVSNMRLVGAVDSARTTVAHNPASAAAWGRLGHVYLAHEWRAEAADCYRNAVKIEPGAFRWLYYLGRTLDNDPAKAADVYARALALDEAYAPAHIHYANALRSSGKSKIAGRHFERALELAPRNPFSELRLGQLALSAKRFETARDHLLRALALNPKQSEVHAALAQVYLALGNRDAANRHAQAAQMPTNYNEMPDPLYKEVEKAGVSKFWFTRRGRGYFMAKDFKRAAGELAVAVSEDEKNPLIWYLYGVSLLGIERDNEAVAALERALSASRGNDHQNENDLLKIYNSLAIAHGRAGSPELAGPYLQKALALNPASIRAMNNLAFYYAENDGNLDEALNLARKAAEVGPDEGGHPMSLDTLGWVYFKRGNYSAALKTLTLAAKLLPDSPTVYYHLGMAYFENRDTRNALKAFKIASKLSSNFPEADETKAMIRQIESQ
ncbi:MAG: tetratricopeptide repeat protein [Candidatus Poribacteria bacterium]|nr:tetratricopeptide repeat protein [Candidatus Poribacteria bacterium]